MVKQSDLFDLIQSLTKSEKRYFRLQTSLHGKSDDSKYQILFNLLDRQEQYDEEAVRAAFETQHPGTRFSDAARYLHQNILKALHLFHLERSVDSRIGMLLHQADILLRKKLYRQCEEIMDKVRELCVLYERPLPALTMLNMQLRFSFLGQSREPAALGERIFQEITHYQQQADELVEFWKLYIRLFTLNQQIGMPRTPDEFAQYMEVMSHKSLTGDLAALSSPAQRYYHLIHIFYAKLTQHYRKEVRHTEILLEFDSRHPGKETHWPNEDYVSSLYNICRACTSARMVEKFTEYHSRLMDVCEKNPDRQGYTWYIRGLALVLDLYLHTGEFDKAETTLHNLEEAMGAFSGQVRIGFEYEVYYMGFLTCFGRQRYDLCIGYLNRILEKRSTEDVRKDVYYVARLALLLVYFELGHFDLLEYLLKSTARFFQSRGYTHEPETLFLSFIRRTLKEGPRREDFVRLANELRSLDRDQLGRNTLDDYFHFTAWMQSKLESRTFAELVKETFAREIVLAAESGKE